MPDEPGETEWRWIASACRAAERRNPDASDEEIVGMEAEIKGALPERVFERGLAWLIEKAIAADMELAEQLFYAMQDDPGSERTRELAQKFAQLMTKLGVEAIGERYDGT